MDEKGYIKYSCNWSKSEKNNHPLIDELINCRNHLYKLKLIGSYSNSIGYGNISLRTQKEQFIITGSSTGGIPNIGKEHFSLVTNYHFSENSLSCSGPIKASSEALSHAAIYEALPEVNSVIHVHNFPLWEKYLNVLPSTPEKIEYGTPEMASELKKLCLISKTKKEKILVMGGHKEGIISFGKNISEASEILLNYFDRI